MHRILAATTSTLTLCSTSFHKLANCLVIAELLELFVEPAQRHGKALIGIQPTSIIIVYIKTMMTNPIIGYYKVHEYINLKSH